MKDTKKVSEKKVETKTKAKVVEKKETNEKSKKNAAVLNDKKEVKKEVKAKKEEVKPTKKEEAKTTKKETNKTEQVDIEIVENVEKSQTSRPKVYHVSLREDGKWQVKFAKGEKVIKTFSTQLEAIDYAKQLANNQNGSIAIHKKDGKIRKQKYKY